MPASETEAAATTSTLIAPVFNIVADATRSPFHAPSLPDTKHCLFATRGMCFCSSANWLKRVLKPIAAELGFKVDLGMFRRGFTTIADVAGGSLKDIQHQLRHASVTTTANIYVQPVPSSVRAIVEKVDRVLRCDPLMRSPPQRL